MIYGTQSWVFESRPRIVGSAAVGGPFEAKGALAKDFDMFFDDLWAQQDSFEKAEKVLLESACDIAIQKSNILKKDINFFLSGDLTNQIISSSFAARTLGIPFLGLYGACTSSIEGLAIACAILESKLANNILVASSSHNAVAEKQYRYPTEYGSQKPPTAQWTVTGAGAAVVSSTGNGPRVCSATIGKVVDMGIEDPFNMGAAMAPAAVDTIEAHFKDLNLGPSNYDLIATGDLGRVGHTIAKDLLAKNGIIMEDTKFVDCGIMIYENTKEVLSGGSGCACVATTTYGHILNMMRAGKLQKVLIVATGALLSPMTYQQNETIPCISHAVAIEA